MSHEHVSEVGTLYATKSRVTIRWLDGTAHNRADRGSSPLLATNSKIEIMDNANAKAEMRSPQTFKECNMFLKEVSENSKSLLFFVEKIYKTLKNEPEIPSDKASSEIKEKNSDKVINMVEANHLNASDINSNINNVRDILQKISRMIA